VCPGIARVPLPAGEYRYEVERGPEYARGGGSFTVVTGRRTEVRLELPRQVDLARRGWYSGDLHVHRRVEDIELLMRAEDLDLAPVITWWNNRNQWTDRELPAKPVVRFDRRRWYHLLAGEDEREGGALLFFNLPRPLDIRSASREYPSPMTFLAAARRDRGAWIDIEKPFWWDVPVWLASGQVDSIGLANNHMCRSRMYESEAWGRPRDTGRLPAPRGNGFWTQELYYHVLDTGLRLPPSAGSASGVLPNPVGYNRVYVHLDRRLTWDRWWRGLKAGRCFVTNGPILRCRANRRLPGHVFRSQSGKPIEIGLEVSLSSIDPVPGIEIVKNGRVLRRVSLAALKPKNNELVLKFDKSGWFLVRAIADVEHTFRFASTGPFYVEIGDQPRRISRGSASFFLDWVNERIDRVKLTDPAQRKAVLAHHLGARRFWQDRLERANAE